MITPIAIALLSVAPLVQQTDTVIALEGESRLELSNWAGEIIVETWDRDAVRIFADHSRRMELEVDRDGRNLEIDMDMRRGYVPSDVDYRLTVPVHMDLKIEGMSITVRVNGVQGDITVSSVNGDVEILNSGGHLVVEAVNGEVIIDGAEGEIEVTAMTHQVRIFNASGDITAESVAGALTMENITSSYVEAGTVAGSLYFEGAIQDRGTYFFGAHAGTVELVLPSNINAEIDALTLVGDIDVDLPGAPEVVVEEDTGWVGLDEKEFAYTMGNGSAQIEVETFSGTIIIRNR